MTRGAAALVLVAAFGACGDRQPPAPTTRALGGDVVARVGAEEVSAATVQRIAAAQALSVDRAAELAVVDALIAAEAGGELPAAARRFEEDRVLARHMVAVLHDEARRLGPPTDEEVAEKTKRHWLRVTRPPTVVTGHAVVLVPEGSDESTWARAGEVAKRIRRATEDAAKRLAGGESPTYDFETGQLTEPTGGLGEFLTKASEVDAAGFKVTAQFLAPFAEDGALIVKEGEGALHATFVKAAFPLQRGEIVDGVRSPYGVHVILGVLRIPGVDLDLEQRRERFASEIYSDRTRAAVDALLVDLKSRATVTVERNADAALAEVKFTP